MFSPVNTRYIGIKSFFLAAIFHLSLLGLFTFTLSVRDTPPEPFFVFLGSILTKHDLVNPGSLDTAYEIGQIQFSDSEAAATPRMTTRNLPLQHDKKPSFLDHPLTAPKKTYKDTRGLSTAKAAPLATEKKKPITEPAPLKIQLKLYPDDQN
ncbi:MAG TPA: hypothetical protein PL155_07500 [Candidatus Omnitrophota bacterium]|nr:hypothetical protein [Candidatus Omnitrophota bacterium]HPD85321.1 hypothetical protein [Candidatus Omnitrophota bacterium]HRZ04178.1 hypothetical protein [Candidatus Omnitrophota bacterium]